MSIYLVIALEGIAILAIFAVMVRKRMESRDQEDPPESAEKKPADEEMRKLLDSPDAERWD